MFGPRGTTYHVLRDTPGHLDPTPAQPQMHPYTSLPNLHCSLSHFPHLHFPPRSCSHRFPYLPPAALSPDFRDDLVTANPKDRPINRPSLRLQNSDTKIHPSTTHEAEQAKWRFSILPEFLLFTIPRLMRRCRHPTPLLLAQPSPPISLPFR
eukprot:6186848-Pleurochrysis_carterae.AAC.3